MTKSILMTGEDIRTEFGWSDDMVRCLLQVPCVPASIRGKHRSDRYRRDRVLATAESPEGRAAKREWDETLRGSRPDPGWTTRLGDIGCLLGISAVAVGRILALLGYRTQGYVANSAITAGCGVRRWDGFAHFSDWHIDRVVCAIQLATADLGTSAVADALAGAIARQNARSKSIAHKRRQEELKAAADQEEQAMIFRLLIELRALLAADRGTSLLNAVEYITPEPAAQLILYQRRSVEMLSIESSGMCHQDPRLSEFVSSVATDLALLERRVKSAGFQS